MKVAFDCSGTLLSNNTHVLALWRWFESKGCEMIIWSNSYGYCQQAQEVHGLIAECQVKTTKWDLDTAVDPLEYYVDVAVDDDSTQTYLAAKNFIWVHEIPDPNEFESKYAYLFNQGEQL